MKWANIVSVMAWALSAGIFVVAGVGFTDAKPSSQSNNSGLPPSIISIDKTGHAISLDALLPLNEIGLIAAAGRPPKPEIPLDIADSVGDDERDDGNDEWSAKPPKSSPSSKSGSSKKSTASSKSNAPSKPRTSSKPASSESKPSKSASSKTTSSKTKSSKQASNETTPADLPCVDINTADESALITIKGIGPVLAAKIIEHRAENGPFQQKEDLLKVKGIGPAKFAGMADRVCPLSEPGFQ